MPYSSASLDISEITGPNVILEAQVNLIYKEVRENEIRSDIQNEQSFSFRIVF